MLVEHFCSTGVCLCLCYAINRVVPAENFHPVLHVPMHVKIVRCHQVQVTHLRSVAASNIEAGEVDDI